MPGLFSQTVASSYIDVVLLTAPGEPQVMIRSRNMVATLRRDASFVFNVLIALVFVGFASVAVFAAVVDLMALRQ
jgi:hypothetical protein